MSNLGRSADKLIDSFVEYVNAEWLYELQVEDVPENLRLFVDEGFAKWKITPIASAPWIDPFKEKLGIPVPLPFESLISRYMFAEFEVGPIEFFANTGRRVRTELQFTAFSHDLSPTLLAAQLVQFGRGAGGASYDAICFDSANIHRGDTRIVQIDHEEILIRDRIRIVREIAPSFVNFMERAVAREFTPPWKFVGNR
jgi:hypothetical protein